MPASQELINFIADFKQKHGDVSDVFIAAVNAGYKSEDVLAVLENNSTSTSAPINPSPQIKKEVNIIPFLLVGLVLLGAGGLIFYQKFLIVTPHTLPNLPIQDVPIEEVHVETPPITITLPIPQKPKEEKAGIFSSSWNPLLFYQCRSYIGDQTTTANSCYDRAVFLSRSSIYCAYRQNIKNNECYSTALNYIGLSEYCKAMGNDSKSCFWYSAIKSNDISECDNAKEYTESCKQSFAFTNAQDCYNSLNGDDRMICANIISSRFMDYDSCRLAGKYESACQFQIAIRNNKIEQCPLSNKTMCVSVIANLLKDPGLCTQATNQEECQYNYALSQISFSHCDNLTGDFKSECFRAFAFYRRDETYCKNTTNYELCWKWVEYFRKTPVYTAPPTGAIIFDIP